MNIRQPGYSRKVYGSPVKAKRQPKPHRIIFGCMAALIALIGWSLIGTSHAAAKGIALKSGWSGYCLDDYRDGSSKTGNQVDLWPCNHSDAQNWYLNLTQIMHSPSQCLTAESPSNIDLVSCSNNANQVWLRDGSGYINPNSGLCLSAPSAGQGQRLDLNSCTMLSSSTQTWSDTFSEADYKCSGDQGDLVACNAVKEWDSWQANPSAHETMLNNYTDGSAYEEWCADFISYVFKESGYPFTNGNYQGWDENLANQVINQGFTYHDSANYTPRPGDVAYFDFPGGHVEIVVSGGPRPTFIYGNSNTIDPLTGNGEMSTNTIINEGSFGKLIYYLSPNKST